MTDAVPPDPEEIASREAKDRIRSGRWLERVRPSRLAVVVVEVTAAVADRARIILAEEGWTVEDLPSGCSSDIDETYVIARKEVHPIFPFDLDDDVHSRIRFIMSRGKIEPVAVTIDISLSAPALGWREWRPEIHGDAKPAVRRKGAPAVPVNGDTDRRTLREIRSEQANSEPRPDTPAENLGEDASREPETTEHEHVPINPVIGIRDLNRRLRSTKLYTSSTDAAQATRTWDRHKRLLGLPEVALLARAAKKQRGEDGESSLKIRRIQSLFLLVIPLGGYCWGSTMGGSWVWILLTAGCACIPIIGGGLWIWSARWRDINPSDRTLDWASYCVVAGIQLILGIALGRTISGLSDSIWISLAVMLMVTMCMYGFGFILRHFPIRVAFRSLLRFGLLLAAYSLWARVTFREFYVSMGVRTGNIDIASVDVIRALWRPTLSAVLIGLFLGAVWLVLYRNRYSEPFNWLMGVLFVMVTVLPLAVAMDNASRAGRVIGSGTNYQYNGFEATPVWVSPASPFGSFDHDGRRSSLASETEPDADGTSVQDPVLMWRVGTTSMQTLLLSLPHSAFVGCPSDPQGDTPAPVVAIPTASIVMKLAQPPAVGCPLFG